MEKLSMTWEMILQNVFISWSSSKWHGKGYNDMEKLVVVMQGTSWWLNSLINSTILLLFLAKKVYYQKKKLHCGRYPVVTGNCRSWGKMGLLNGGVNVTCGRKGRDREWE